MPGQFKWKKKREGEQQYGCGEVRGAGDGQEGGDETIVCINACVCVYVCVRGCGCRFRGGKQWEEEHYTNILCQSAGRIEQGAENEKERRRQ